jgi:hypothetical protein
MVERINGTNHKGGIAPDRRAIRKVFFFHLGIGVQ